MTYSQLHLHTYYSLDGLSSPESIAKRCKELGIQSCAMTDHGNLAAVEEFISAMKEEKIKPILGCELYISSKSATLKESENRKLHHLVVMAKNLNGWKNLVKAVSRSNDKDVYYYRPRLDYSLLKHYSKDLIGISGHPGSLLFNTLFTSMDVYDKTDITEIQSYLVNDPISEGIKVVEFYKTIFDDFFIEINLFDSKSNPALIVAADILRKIGQITNTKCVAISDSHYARQEDAQDQRLIICSMLKTTLKKVKQQMDQDEFGLSCFFKSDKHYIPSCDELLDCGNIQEELDNTNYVASLCEEYTIFKKPVLPKFSNNEEEELLKLARDGYIRRKKPNWDEKIYGERAKYELEFIKEFNLCGYFLIVQDYTNYFKNKGHLIGPGRGSVGGSLVAYLIGITEVDPIPSNLIFERFLNRGRNTKDNVEYPDIDMDFPIEIREEIIEYISNKYGKECVSQIATYGRYLGAGALKEVLRIHDVCSFSEMNEITAKFPNEASITEDLDKMEHQSIIRWVLENEPEKVENYCRLQSDGTLTGEYAQYFEQAIRLEGVIKTQGKHAAGLVISPHNLSDYCPMIYDKSSENKILGIDMNAAQKFGYIKFDILGVASLSKLDYINKLLEKKV